MKSSPKKNYFMKTFVNPGAVGGEKDNASFKPFSA